MTEEELRERVGSIVRGIVGYDGEDPAIDEIMGLFAEHHCASCDMHSCGDRERLNPRTGREWTPEERRAMGMEE